MTENEQKAIEFFQKDFPDYIHEEPSERQIAYNTAIQALEEIQQYRAIGTVEGYELAIQSSIENYNLYREYKAKVQDFEAIGTIEEFKALKERNVADEVKENNKQLVCEIKIDAEMMRKIIDEKMTQIELDIQGIRAKAIDEFFQELQKYEDDDMWLRLKMSSIYEISEQLKEGGINE